MSRGYNRLIYSFVPDIHAKCREGLKSLSHKSPRASQNVQNRDSDTSAKHDNPAALPTNRPCSRLLRRALKPSPTFCVAQLPFIESRAWYDSRRNWWNTNASHTVPETRVVSWKSRRIGIPAYSEACRTDLTSRFTL